MPPARWPRLAPLSAALIVTAFGLIVIVAWYAHWPRVLQIFPHAAPTQYNTALCFILCAAGLFLLNMRHVRSALWPSGIVALLASLTLLEYLTGWDLGIDQLFFKPYFEIATAYPGRMAPLTAICFIFLSTALCFAGTAGRRPGRLAVSGLLACVVAVVGLIALLGYLTGIDSAYGWGAYSRMAFNTSIALILLGAGLLSLCWQMASKQDRNFVHWMPITAAGTLIVMVAAMSIGAIVSLRQALDWHKHTYEVLITAESLSASFTNIQSEMRGHVLMEKPGFPTAYTRGMEAASRQLAQLTKLTRDNPVQQRRLKELTMSLTHILSQTDHVIYTRQNDGRSAAIKMESPSEDEEIMAPAAALVDAFIQEEQRLLVQRGAVADVDFRNTGLLLGFGSLLAAILLAAGTLLVRRENHRRHILELELREVTDTVKILSGLLPICAHCKSIRDDKGYWNKIEAYIQKHSEARFSHGLCESCVRELYPEIADKVLERVRASASKDA